MTGPRVRALCPWGCGKDVAINGQGWPMPHRGADGGVRCKPTPEWVATPVASLLTTPAAAVSEPDWRQFDPDEVDVPDACDEAMCGRPRGVGRPPRGWLRIHASDAHLSDRWYCSIACVATRNGYRLAGVPTPIDAVDPPPRDGRLDDLNRLAGTHLTIMDATPHRIRVALDRVFARLTAEIEAQAAQDRRDRPASIVRDDGTIDPAGLAAVAERMAG